MDERQKVLVALAAAGGLAWYFLSSKNANAAPMPATGGTIGGTTGSTTGSTIPQSTVYTPVQSWTYTPPPSGSSGSGGTSYSTDPAVMAEVRKYQLWLNILGYGPLVQDGKFGPATQRAWNAFKADNELQNASFGVVATRLRAAAEYRDPQRAAELGSLGGWRY